jgi:hypothetical protein
VPRARATYRAAARSVVGSSRNCPSPALHARHKIPRTRPLAWQWSTQSGSGRWQIAQRPCCDVSSAVKSSLPSAYRRRRSCAWTLPGLAARQARSLSRSFVREASGSAAHFSRASRARQGLHRFLVPQSELPQTGHDRRRSGGICARACSCGMHES